MTEIQWIPIIPVDELPDDLHLMARKWIAMENGDPNFIQTVGHVPETLRRYIRWSSGMWRRGLIPNRTKEICRIRIANANDCRYCMTMRYETAQSQGMTESLERQLDDYEAGNFPEREKAALRYTDEIYLDNITWDYDRVTDDVYRRLSAQFTEPEIVELTWAICIAIEYGRNFTVWGVPVTEEKVREPLDQLTERLNSTGDVRVDAENHKALTELAITDRRDAQSISTLLARADMLGPVLRYHRFIQDDGLLEDELKQAVKAEVFRLEDGCTDVRDDLASCPPRIQAALQWTRGMALDFRELVGNADFVAEVGPHFTTQELVELGMYSGFCLALRRIRAVLGRRVLTEPYGLAVATLTIGASPAGQLARERLMTVLVVSDEAEFDRVVLRSGVPALLDFWAEWCTPCRMLAPVLAEIAEAYGDALNVVKVNVDACPAIAEHYGVASIPFLVICRGDEVLKNLPGIRPKPVLLKELKSCIGSASSS